MLTYKCKILTNDGIVKIITINSKDKESASHVISNMGLHLLSIKKSSPLKLNRNELLLFTQTLHILLKSHISLKDAVELAKTSFKKDKLKELIEIISRGLDSGQHLSSILKESVMNISTLYIGLLKVGEQSGNLTIVLNELKKYLEREKRYRDKIRSAMTYPVLILFVSIAFTIIFSLYIHPQLNSMFDSLGIMTSDLQNRANLFIYISYFCLSVILSITIILKLNNQLTLSLPVIGNIIKQNETFKLLFSMYILTNNSVDIVTALQESKTVLNNSSLIENIDKIVEETNQGMSLSDSFNMSSFPNRVSSFIKIGEQSGNISSIFMDLSNYYNEMNDQRVEKIMALIDPIFTLVIGIVLIILVQIFILPLMTHMGAMM